MEQGGQNNTKKVIAGLVVLVVVVLIVFGVKAFSPDKTVNKDNSSVSTNTAPPTTTETSTVNDTATTTQPTQAYKDGTYNATGSYDTPGGVESIKLTVTLSNDKVTSSEVESQAHTTDAKEFQRQFIGGFKSLVVGRDVSSIKLSRVSGSSLTSGGFNSALNEIKNQAKS